MRKRHRGHSIAVGVTVQRSPSTHFAAGSLATVARGTGPIQAFTFFPRRGALGPCSPSERPINTPLASVAKFCVSA